MRPEILTPLFAEIGSLPGIGAKTSASLAKLLGRSEIEGTTRIIDLLFHLPRTIIDRRYRPKIAQAIIGTIATIEVRILSHRPSSPNSRTPHTIKVEDETGELDISFFKASGKWLERELPIGETRIISGRLEEYRGRKTMTHPDHIVTQEGLKDLPLIEPVYSLSSGISQKIISKAIRHALSLLPDLPLWDDPTITTRHKWLSFKQTLVRLHSPEELEDLSPTNIYRRRLAYDELLSGQLALSLVRQKMKRSGGRSWQGDKSLRTLLTTHIPFTLTAAQQRSIDEITTDLSSTDRMMRLLQGDVGSGKTIVAFIASCSVIESGGQVAFMAPTELLARQHFQTLAPLAKKIGINISILTGSDKGKSRKEILSNLESGTINLLIGTHTLFQEGVSFKNLAFSIVDEQHRFGVHQRLALTSKGISDVLLMTATPIPRTLVLTHYGSMDVSKLDELPPGRGEIETHALSTSRIEKLLSRINSAVKSGEKIYWVCP